MGLVGPADRAQSGDTSAAARTGLRSRGKASGAGGRSHGPRCASPSPWPHGPGSRAAGCRKRGARYRRYGPSRRSNGTWRCPLAAGAGPAARWRAAGVPVIAGWRCGAVRRRAGQSGMQEGVRRSRRARKESGHARRTALRDRRKRPCAMGGEAAETPAAAVTAFGAMRETRSEGARKPLRAARYGWVGHAGSRRGRRASVASSHVISPTDRVVRAAQEGPSSCVVRFIIVLQSISIAIPWRGKIPVAKPRRDTLAVLVRFPRPMIEALDRLRAEKPEHPSRPEMIRRIVSDWLEDNERSGRNLRA